MIETHPTPLPVEYLQNDLGLPDAWPTVIVAPEMHGRRDFVVIRETGEPDADYQSRCDQFVLLLDHAAKD